MSLDACIVCILLLKVSWTWSVSKSAGTRAPRGALHVQGAGTVQGPGPGPTGAGQGRARGVGADPSASRGESSCPCNFEPRAGGWRAGRISHRAHCRLCVPSPIQRNQGHPTHPFACGDRLRPSFRLQRTVHGGPCGNAASEPRCWPALDHEPPLYYPLVRLSHQLSGPQALLKPRASLRLPHDARPLAWSSASRLLSEVTENPEEKKAV